MGKLRFKQMKTISFIMRRKVSDRAKEGGGEAKGSKAYDDEIWYKTLVNSPPVNQSHNLNAQAVSTIVRQVFDISSLA